MSIKSNYVFPFIVVIAAMLLSAGCAHVISKEVLQDVDTSVSFVHLSKDPDAYTGKTVLFGGDVIETQNLSDKTLVVVLQRPLGEIEYTYPIIEKRELYLWPEEEAASDEPDVHFGLGIGVGFNDRVAFEIPSPLRREG